MFQIGSLPLFNAFLYRNSQGQLAADLLFLALARGMDGKADLNALDLFQDNLWDHAALIRDWLAIPPQNFRVANDCFTCTPCQQTTQKPTFSNPISVVDNIFALLADEIDSFGDVGD
jgi:hypothetical protein